jgi:hypothetical protein
MISEVMKNSGSEHFFAKIRGQSTFSDMVSQASKGAVGTPILDCDYLPSAVVARYAPIPLCTKIALTPNLPEKVL